MADRGFKRVPSKDLRRVKGVLLRIGVQLQKERQEKEMTQEEVAKTVGVNINTIKFIEQGRRLPSLTMLLRIARVFNKTLSLSED